ncbi:uncharacterized protein A1O5_02950 [Cladophialophora psammophila CBS 110553]|uniref:Transcription factor domain-containing protein n=1 Tax=Cladophialophora psammophila CBS 110553 TaxID=1182543 RepID=W9X779_9EURO|nr:uncharacterized protein A1O5_02950 [Cladophialophora psammophila CBS 110553]EXJ73190.1 hypothetical protein A1O5_02950 [Cladophialophora psammophila CBS 110553]
MPVSPHRSQFHVNWLSDSRSPPALFRFDIVKALSLKNRAQHDRALRRHQDQAVSGQANSAGKGHAACDKPDTPVTGPTGSETRSNDAAADDLSGNGLLEFFQHGTSAESWSRFDSLKEARMCYVGTPISNLAYLVSQERCGDDTNLHFPIPQIHRAVSWTIGSSLPSLRLRQPVESDLSSLPVKEVRDALIEAFFRDIYPIFPILDEAEWQHHCASPDSPPPLLLYQAILLAADILYAFSPGSVRTSGNLQDTSVLDSRLATWVRTLPPGNDFYTLQLRLHYNTALLHLHRTVLQESKAPIATLTHSAKLCESAAETSVGILSSLIQSGTIRRCYFTASTAVMAAAIQFIREMRSAIAQNSSLLALQAQDRLEGCFPVMNELTRYWPATSATLKLFQHVSETTKPMMDSHFNNQVSRVSSDAAAVNASCQDLGPENWNSMFSNLYTIAPEPDWSNIESWFEV